MSYKCHVWVHSIYDTYITAPSRVPRERSTLSRLLRDKLAPERLHPRMLAYLKLMFLRSRRDRSAPALNYVGSIG